MAIQGNIDRAAFRLWLEDLPADYRFYGRDRMLSLNCPIARYLSHREGRPCQFNGQHFGAATGMGLSLLAPSWAREFAQAADDMTTGKDELTPAEALEILAEIGPTAVTYL